MPGVASKEFVPSPEVVAAKVRRIQELMNVYKVRVARLLGVSHVILDRWMKYLEIPEDKFRELCDIELQAVKVQKEYEKNRDCETVIPASAQDYIEKQIGMHKYLIGEIFIRNLIDKPMKMTDLQRIAGIHRQSASRKVKQMEHAKVIECDRSTGHVVCRLRPGVQWFILTNYRMNHS